MSDNAYWEFPLMLIGMVGGIIAFALVSNGDGHFQPREAIVLGLTLAWTAVWGAISAWRVK